MGLDRLHTYQVDSSSMETTDKALTTIKKTITWVDEIYGEAMFCSALSPSHIESGDFSSVSFGLSIDQCFERYKKGDLLTDVTSSLISAQLEVFGVI